MAVPQYSGNAFTQALNSMNDFFGGLQANRRALIQNRFLPQALELANAGASLQNTGQDLSNQTAQFNLSNLLPIKQQQEQQALDLATQLQPSQVGTANLNYENLQKMSPIQLAIAQAQQVAAQNQNDLFPLQKQQLSLQNQGLGYQNQAQSYQNQFLKQGILPVTNPMTGQTTYVNAQQLNAKPGQAMVDENGNIVYAPTTQALGTAQQMQMARNEAEILHKGILQGLEPYQGVTGKAKLYADFSLYNAGLASPEMVKRLQNYNAAVSAAPTYYAALGRAATGGVPSSAEMEKMEKAYNFPNAGLPLRGEDATASQNLVAEMLKQAGKNSIGGAISPIGTEKGSEPQNQFSNLSDAELEKIAGGS